MSTTTTLGRAFVEFLRDLVSRQILEKNAVTLLLENAAEVDDLKRVVEVGDKFVLAQHLKTQKNAGKLTDSMYERLLAALETKEEPQKQQQQQVKPILDFYALPRPAVERIVRATQAYEAVDPVNQLSFSAGKMILVLHQKAGAEWAVGELLDNTGARGLFPVSFTMDPTTTSAAATPLSMSGPMPSLKMSSQANAMSVSGPMPTLKKVQTVSAGPVQQPRPELKKAQTLSPSVTRSSTIILDSDPAPKPVAAVAAQDETALVTGGAAAASSTATPSVKFSPVPGIRYAFLEEPRAELDSKKKTILNLRRYMLLRAAYDGDEKLFRMLVKQGVPLDHRDPGTGDTALMCAVFNKKSDFVQKFLVKEKLCSVSGLGSFFSSFFLSSLPHPHSHSPISHSHHHSFRG